MRRTSKLDRLIAVTMFLLVFTQPASAVIYKWKDDNGKVYYTDDLNRVPLQYRSKPPLEVLRGTSEPPSAPKSPEPGEVEGKSKKAEKPATAGKKSADSKKLAAEKPNIEAAIAHFESEAKRDEQLLTIQPNMLNGKYFVLGIQQLLPAKKALAEKIDKSESPILKVAAEFLKSSIAQDEQDNVPGDQMPSRGEPVFNRLKAELPAITQLTDQLKSELGKAGEMPAVQEPSTPVEAPTEVERMDGESSEQDQAQSVEPADNGEKPPVEGETGATIKSESLEK